MKKVFCFVLVLTTALILAACATPMTEQMQGPAVSENQTRDETVATQPTPSEEMSTWQEYYELGLELYREDNYEEASDAFVSALST